MSAILITGILLAAVAGTYIWAQPIMQKATDQRRIEYAKEMLTSINDGIENAAMQKQQKVVPVEFDRGTLKLTPEEGTQEYVLQYEIETNIPMLASTAWVPLTGTELPLQENAKFVTAWCYNGKDPSAPDATCAGVAKDDSTFWRAFTESGGKYASYYTSCRNLGSPTPSYFGISDNDLELEGDIYRALVCDSGRQAYACLVRWKNGELDTSMSCDDAWKVKNDRAQVKDLRWQVAELHTGDRIAIGLRLLSGFVDKMGMKGKSAPCVIIARSLSPSQNRRALITVKCRPIYDSQDNIAYDIVLKPGQITLAPAGSHTITIRYKFDKTLPPKAGEQWTTKEITVEVSLD
jgi:hypothetical protein